MELGKDGKWREAGYLHPRVYAWVIRKKWDPGKAPWWLVQRFALACVAWQRQPTVYVSEVEYQGMILKAVKAAEGPAMNRGEYFGV